MRTRTLLIATAITALTAGSGLVFAQAPGGGANEHNRGSTSGPASGGMQQKAPNARGAQGEQRNAEQPGTKAPNARGAQGEQRETTGQAPNERNNRMGQKPNEERKGQKPNERNERMGERPNERNRSTTGQGTMENRGAPTENRTGASTERRGSVNLSSEQRTRIHTIIVGERSAPRVGHVDFSVNVGTRVPRTVHLAAIPQDIVTIEPSWRGFEYFLVGDQIVVVDPATMEIVAVLPA